MKNHLVPFRLWFIFCSSIAGAGIAFACPDALSKVSSPR
jgi:hypothetical protein